MSKTQLSGTPRRQVAGIPSNVVAACLRAASHGANPRPRARRRRTPGAFGGGKRREVSRV